MTALQADRQFFSDIADCYKQKLGPTALLAVEIHQCGLLELAVFRREYSIVEYLLTTEDFDKTLSRECYTQIFCSSSCSTDSKELCHNVLNLAAKIDEASFLAVCVPHCKTHESLHEYNAPPQHKEPLQAWDKQYKLTHGKSAGNTILHKMVRTSRFHKLEERCFANPSLVNQKNNKKEIPLHVAVKDAKLKYETWRTLIDAGSDIETVDDTNQTPLCYLLEQHSSSKNLKWYVWHLLAKNINNPKKLTQLYFELDSTWRSALFRNFIEISMIPLYYFGFGVSSNGLLVSGVNSNRLLISAVYILKFYEYRIKHKKTGKHFREIVDTSHVRTVLVFKDMWLIFMLLDINGCKRFDSYPLLVALHFYLVNVVKILKNMKYKFVKDFSTKKEILYAQLIRLFFMLDYHYASEIIPTREVKFQEEIHRKLSGIIERFCGDDLKYRPFLNIMIKHCKAFESNRNLEHISILEQLVILRNMITHRVKYLYRDPEEHFTPKVFIFSLEMLIKIGVMSNNISILPELCKLYYCNSLRYTDSIKYKLGNTYFSVIDLAIQEGNYEVLNYLLRINCICTNLPNAEYLINVLFTKDDSSLNSYFSLLSHSQLISPSLLHNWGNTFFRSVGIPPNCINFLEKLKVDINAVDQCGNTPLHLALKHGKANILHTAGFLDRLIAFIEAGSNVNAANSVGETPLSLSLNINDSMTYPCFMLLLKNGANPLQKTPNGTTLFDTFLTKTNSHTDLECVRKFIDDKKEKNLQKVLDHIDRKLKLLSVNATNNYL